MALVFIPLLISMVRLPSLRLASKISESLSISMTPSKPRSCGVTIPSKLEKDNCSPSEGPSRTMFTTILSFEVIVIRSSPVSFVITSYS